MYTPNQQLGTSGPPISEGYANEEIYTTEFGKSNRVHSLKLPREEAQVMNEPRLNNIEPLRKTESFEKRRTKGGRKKGRGIKWEKASNTNEILGFGQQETSPFDQDSGYNINELDLMHFTETP